MDPAPAGFFSPAIPALPAMPVGRFRLCVQGVGEAGRVVGRALPFLFTLPWRSSGAGAQVARPGGRRCAPEGAGKLLKEGL